MHEAILNFYLVDCFFLSSVNGSWSQWSSWQPCSVTCGDGNRVRARTCSNPAPKWNGRDCPGTNSSTESCNMRKCKGRCHYLNFFYFPECVFGKYFWFDRFSLTTDMKIKEESDMVFSSPRFSHLRTWNFTSGWVRNPGMLGTGISQAVV